VKFVAKEKMLQIPITFLSLKANPQPHAVFLNLLETLDSSQQKVVRFFLLLLRISAAVQVVALLHL